MAFALTRFKSYGRLHEGATRSFSEQVCELHVTAANTNVAYDLDNSAGTFWTAVQADATFGALATQALFIFLTKIPSVIHRCISIDGEPLLAPYFLVASGASGQQYTRAIGTTTPHMPSLAFVSGSAPTSITLVIAWTLLDGAEAIVSDLGQAVT